MSSSDSVVDGFSVAGFSIAILAAGLGTRLKSKTAKVLHRAGGRALVEHVVGVALKLAPPERVFVIVGHQADAVRALLAPSGVGFIEQHEQLGTGHAILSGRAQLAAAAPHLLVLSGDVPLITVETLRHLMRAHLEGGAAATLLSVKLDQPAEYGRIVRDGKGDFQDIVEFKSASAEQRKIREINAGIYCFQTAKLFEQLAKVTNRNSAGEYYLTDVPALLRRAGNPIAAIAAGSPEEMLGINNRAELADMDARLRERKARELMLAGVTIYGVETCVIDPDVEIGADSVIGPCVALYGKTKIGENCVVRAYTTITDSTLDDGAVIHECCWLSAAHVGSRASIGPFARLREGSDIGAEARIGNFVETKKTRVGRRSKAQHLAYLGDASIGENVNIGAGTITCNYDGVHKNRTTIEDGVFVGTNSSLVAPLTVGRNAYVAAGSVITGDVPEDALAIARGRQSVKEGWSRERRERLKPASVEH